MADNSSEKKASKSAVIKEFAAKNPGMKPQQIAEALVAQGHAVTSAYVSVTLSNERRAARADKSPAKKADKPVAAKREPKPKSAPTIVQPTVSPSAADLHAAKSFVAEVGSIDKASKALDEYRLLVA